MDTEEYSTDNPWRTVVGRRKKQEQYDHGSHGTGPHGTGPHGTGPHGTGPHGTGPHGTGPHGTGPHGTGPHGTGPHGIEKICEQPVYVNKISEPCWFFNNGGCKNKDGTEKIAEECKYLHIISTNVKRPPHLTIKKPCDKYNLEGECKWYNNCKYSHRNLSSDEWSRFYPGIPYTLRTNVQKRLQIENNVTNIEGRLNIIEFKQDGMCRDVQHIGQTLEEVIRQLKKILEDFSLLVQNTRAFQK